MQLCFLRLFTSSRFQPCLIRIEQSVTEWYWKFGGYQHFLLALHCSLNIYNYPITQLSHNPDEVSMTNYRLDKAVFITCTLSSNIIGDIFPVNEYFFFHKTLFHIIYIFWQCIFNNFFEHIILLIHHVYFAWTEYSNTCHIIIQISIL